MESKLGHLAHANMSDLLCKLWKIILQNQGEKLPYKAPTPLLSGYHPEIDVSSKLEESEASYFHSLVGVLWWIVELG